MYRNIIGLKSHELPGSVMFTLVPLGPSIRSLSLDVLEHFKEKVHSIIEKLGQLISIFVKFNDYIYENMINEEFKKLNCSVQKSYWKTNELIREIWKIFYLEQSNLFKICAENKILFLEFIPNILYFTILNILIKTICWKIYRLSNTRFNVRLSANINRKAVCNSKIPALFSCSILQPHNSYKLAGTRGIKLIFRACVKD
ncbi:hypothetical protein BpHYR1_050392 [Brachionus plicatilis]|uniref:Uncharacterized protein n=1 Tax=Brachionus plicatilis TaxID=10195 RepID=A0A3M7SBV4_BRAPC|nr:hypothetical protein BpHYR1_050392 [Brachionus plicatilis]